MKEGEGGEASLITADICAYLCVHEQLRRAQLLLSDLLQTPTSARA